MKKKTKQTYRDVLAGRIIELCNRAAKLDLPVKITGIGIFGSFCRGKKKPNDVDLVLFYQHESFPRWKDFECKLFELACRHDDMDSCDSPGDWAREDGLEEPYRTWCGAVTRTMIDNMSWRFLSQYEITLRILCKGLPKLKFAQLYSDTLEEAQRNLTCGTIYMIWTPADQDVRSKLVSIISGQNDRKLLEEAYRGFLPQLELSIQEVTRKQDDIRRVMSTRRSIRFVESWGSHRDLVEKFRDQYDSDDKEAWRKMWVRPEPTQVDLSDKTTEWLSEHVEQMRQTMKSHGPLMRVLRVVFYHLADYFSGYMCDRQACDADYQSDLKLAVYHMCQGLPKKLTPLLNEQLRQFNVPFQCEYGDRGEVKVVLAAACQHIAWADVI